MDEATEAAYENPAHAAARSIAPTPGAPISSPTRQATEGMDSGAVEVPQMTRSTEAPLDPGVLQGLLRGLDGERRGVLAFAPRSGAP